MTTETYTETLAAKITANQNGISTSPQSIIQEMDSLLEAIKYSPTMQAAGETMILWFKSKHVRDSYSPIAEVCRKAKELVIRGAKVRDTIVTLEQKFKSRNDYRKSLHDDLYAAEAPALPSAPDIDPYMIDQPKTVDSKNGIKYTPEQMEAILEDFRIKVLQSEDKLVELITKYSKDIVSLKAENADVADLYERTSSRYYNALKADQSTDVRNLLRTEDNLNYQLKIIEAQIAEMENS
jgi:hypothetical protein